MKRIRLIAINFLVLIGIVFLLELGVRLFFPFVQSQKIDSELFEENRFGNSSGLRPNSSGKAFGKRVNIDNLGFRLDDRPASEDGRKWLLLGDSVTFGVGVEDDETFAALLEKKMTGYNILNPSVPGYNCTDYRNVLGALIEESELGIEQVLMCYCLNDVYQNKEEDLQAGRSNFLKLSTHFLRGNSMLYNWLKGLVTNRPAAYYKYDLQFYEKESAAYQTMIDLVLECDSMCQSNGVGFAFFAMPYSHQYSINQDPFALQEQIQSDLIAYNVKVISHPGATILSAYDKHPEKAYLFGDGIHFSKEGHATVADHLLRNLSMQPKVLDSSFP